MSSFLRRGASGRAGGKHRTPAKAPERAPPHASAPPINGKGRAVAMAVAVSVPGAVCADAAQLDVAGSVVQHAAQCGAGDAGGGALGHLQPPDAWLCGSSFGLSNLFGLSNFGLSNLDAPNGAATSAATAACGAATGGATAGAAAGGNAAGAAAAGGVGASHLCFADLGFSQLGSAFTSSLPAPLACDQGDSLMGLLAGLGTSLLGPPSIAPPAAAHAHTAAGEPQTDFSGILPAMRGGGTAHAAHGMPGSAMGGAHGSMPGSAMGGAAGQSSRGGLAVAAHARLPCVPAEAAAGGIQGAGGTQSTVGAASPEAHARPLAAAMFDDRSNKMHSRLSLQAAHVHGGDPAHGTAAGVCGEDSGAHAGRNLHTGRCGAPHLCGSGVLHTDGCGAVYTDGGGAPHLCGSGVLHGGADGGLCGMGGGHSVAFGAEIGAAAADGSLLDFGVGNADSLFGPPAQATSAAASKPGAAVQAAGLASAERVGGTGAASVAGKLNSERPFAALFGNK